MSWNDLDHPWHAARSHVLRAVELASPDGILEDSFPPKITAALINLKACGGMLTSPNLPVVEAMVDPIDEALVNVQALEDFEPGTEIVECLTEARRIFNGDPEPADTED